MYLHKLSDFLRNRFQSKTTSPRPHNRLRLEELEDRLVPTSLFIPTYTNASIQISPAIFGSVTETVTATVTPFPPLMGSPPSFTVGQIPPGATPPPGGTILFNLNNQQASATLNGNGQATVSFTVPFLSFVTSQTLEVHYQGLDQLSTGGNDWFSVSDFLAPIYKNFDNLIFNSTITFAQLTPQQVYAPAFSTPASSSSNPSPQPTTLKPFNTAQGETDNVGGGLLVFNYIDPGTINSITVLGISVPGSFALQLGAFSGL